MMDKFTPTGEVTSQPAVSPHCATEAHSGMAVITIAASPHWAIPHSVEHCANVITLGYTLLWARFNVECVSFESPLSQ